MPNADNARHPYDVIVVGGGVLGHAIALELAHERLHVLLLYPQNHGRDSATLAAGAMIGAFGELSCTPADESERRRLEFRIQAQDLHLDWLAGLREASGQEIFTTHGLFMIANNGGRQDRFHLNQIQSELARYGRRNEWVEPTEIPSLRPHDGHQAFQALFIHDDLTIDSAQLMAALGTAFSASPYGHVLHDRASAVDLDERADEWYVTTAEHGRLRAPKVVVCAGARVPAALGEATLPQLRLPVLYFAKGIGCVVSGAPNFPHAIRTPNRSDACGLHVVPRAHNRLYIGASNHYGYATAAARGITPGEINAILGDTVREINTTLRDTTIEDLRVGLRPVSGDECPLIGRTRLPGLFVATGTFRTGIVMAPLIAQVVAAEVLDRPAPVSNPFAADDSRQVGSARRNNPDPAHDLNVANLYANRGLRAYTQGKLNDDQEQLEQAVSFWREYVHLAGEHADRRIIDLMTQIDTAHEYVW